MCTLTIHTYIHTYPCLHIRLYTRGKKKKKGYIISREQRESYQHYIHTNIHTNIYSLLNYKHQHEYLINKFK